MTSRRFDTAPLIETERLRLRAVRRDDLDACHAMWSHPGLRRAQNAPPPTREESWARMISSAGLWPLLGFGFWLIEERTSGHVVGDVGALIRERVMSPPLGDDPEVGWALAPPVQGRGYAAEALKAALAWLDANVRSPRLVCVIDPGNEPSIRLAMKAGFREIAKAMYQESPILQFERRMA